jgi:hypothetical protein
MQIDSFTVLLFGLFIKLVLGGLFLVFWYKQRSASWYAWWAATFFLACTATVLFASRGFAADILSIGIGNVALMAPSHATGRRPACSITSPRSAG